MKRYLTTKQVKRYLTTQTRATGFAKDEICKLTPRIKEAQGKLDEAVATMKKSILLESEKRVSEVEDAVAEEAEKSFSKGDERTCEEIANATDALRVSLGRKVLAAKVLGKAPAKTITEELRNLLKRLHEARKKNLAWQSARPGRSRLRRRPW
jgi:hypothetical protein